MLSNIFTAAMTLAAFPLMASAAPATIEARAPLEGYGVEPFTWKVSPRPGEPALEVRGTIEEVRARMLELNPNYDADFGNSTITAEPAEDEEAEGGLQKRANFANAKFICGWQGATNWAAQSRVDDGIKYLRGVSGKPSEGPGPGRCGRVSCSNGAGIWWCNDNSFTKVLNSFGSIADGAQYIVDKCKMYNTLQWIVAGQAFEPTGWNVIVRKDSC